MSEFVQDTVSLTDDLAQERVLDLSDMADEPGGALSPGWYPAEVVEGYATRKGKQLMTGDSVSHNGDSHNLQLCFKLQPPKGDVRTLQGRQNYRPNDFTPERVQFIKRLREELKGVRDWPDRDAQRTSLALAKLGQLGKATKIGLPLTAQNTLVAAKFIGAKLDVRLIIKDQYNEIVEFAEAGTRSGRKID
jgi:hypothetical protein